MAVTAYAALGTPTATMLDRSTTATRARRARRSVTLASASVLLAPRGQAAALQVVGRALPLITMPRTAATAVAAYATLTATRKGSRHTAANLLLRFVVLLVFVLLRRPVVSLRRARSQLLRAPPSKRRPLLLPLPQPLPLPPLQAFRRHGLAASPTTTPTMVVIASAGHMIRTVRPARQTATTSMAVDLDKYAQPASARTLGLSCSPARPLNLPLPRRHLLRLPRLHLRLPL